MKKIIVVVFLVLFSSCKSSETVIKHFIDENYEVFKVEDEKAILVLFPCLPCDIENTKNEFPIIEKATNNKISVVLMNYNNKLFLKDNELNDLSKLYTSIFDKMELKSKNIYIGGFSGGGNVSLLLSDYLVKVKNEFLPKGVFIIDSPIDLLGLYRVAEKNVTMDFSEESLEESNWIINEFTADFGNPNDSIHLYEKFSPFTSETNTISNLENLKDTKIRFYTEPDLNWWKTNKNNDKEDLNAYFIEKLQEVLKNKKFKKVELITTVNKGFRANGTRHPHSWSIVDKDELLKWILE